MFLLKAYGMLNIICSRVKHAKGKREADRVEMIHL